MAETLTLDTDGFMRLVTEEHLQVEGPIAGYLYTGKQGKAGWEVYKTVDNPHFALQQRRRNTQNNGAGGALSINLVCNAGQAFRVTAIYALGAASAGATLVGVWYDEDGAVIARLINVAAGASREANIPSVGQLASTNQNILETNGMILLPGQYIRISSSAALQTEYLEVYVSGLSLTNQQLVVTTTGSAGTPSLAANTISDANASQVIIWP